MTMPGSVCAPAPLSGKPDHAELVRAARIVRGERGVGAALMAGSASIDEGIDDNPFVAAGEVDFLADAWERGRHYRREALAAVNAGRTTHAARVAEALDEL